MKAQLQAELAAAPDDGTRENITAAFAAREKALEHDIDHKPMEVSSIPLQNHFLPSPPISTPSQPRVHATTAHTCFVLLPYSQTHLTLEVSYNFLSK